MTVESPPGVLNDISTDAKVQRHLTQALAGAPVGSFAGGVSASGAAHGICYPDALEVTQQSSPGMGVTVAAGTALITGTVSAEQGPYSFYNDAAVDLTIAAAHATQDRYDLVVAQIQDDDYAGSSTTPRLTVVAGTPAGSPSDPSLSSTPNALVLARVEVPAGAESITTANITDLRLGARASNWYQAWGTVGYSERATNFGSVTSVTAIGSCTTTFNAVAGRRYRTTGNIIVQVATADQPIQLRIRDSAGSRIGAANGSASVAGASGQFTLVVSRVERCLAAGGEMAPGSQTRDLALGPASGTASTQGIASSDLPAYILVEDIGPA